jgi:aconitase B
MSEAPLIDEEVAAFLQSGISMHAASVAPGNVPALTRVAGCRVAPDRRTVTVYLVESQSRELLDDVRASGAIAAVFTKPGSHRTVQLKGVDAHAVAVRPEDAADVDRQVAIFDAILHKVGFPERFGWTLAGGSPLGLAGIAFTPASAFVQTPGPSAGTALKCR